MILTTEECMDISLKVDFCKNPSSGECVNLDSSINCRDKLSNDCN
jgi:hypothetical protein